MHLAHGCTNLVSVVQCNVCGHAGKLTRGISVTSAALACARCSSRVPLIYGQEQRHCDQDMPFRPYDLVAACCTPHLLNCTAQARV